jgi:hypothetical protein
MTEEKANALADRPAAPTDLVTPTPSTPGGRTQKAKIRKAVDGEAEVFVRALVIEIPRLYTNPISRWGAALVSILCTIEYKPKLELCAGRKPKNVAEIGYINLVYKHLSHEALCDIRQAAEQWAARSER